jgi:GNAT superfamily N-acetyltransferase
MPKASRDRSLGTSAIIYFMFSTRLADKSDIPQIKALIPISVKHLQANHYSNEQMTAALGTVFDVDSQLIEDKTYFVTEFGSKIIGCGGWSRRKTLFGGDRAKSETDSLLNPLTDSARVRAFFVHPDFARKGIGSHIMELCEKAILDFGFSSVRIVATLAGEPLYARFGYHVSRRYSISLHNGSHLPVVDMIKNFHTAELRGR